jgi:protein tyrosine phosphatase
VLVALKDDSKLYHLYAEGDKNTTVELVDVNEFPGSQKKSKVHSVGVHPILSHIIACCTRTGLCVFHLQKQSYVIDDRQTERERERERD